MALSEHLYRSRHGIFYFRVVVPKHLRVAFPELPREVKVSTETGNRRVSARRAREIYLSWLQACNDLEAKMEKPRFSGWTAVLGPNELEIRTDRSDSPEERRKLLEIVANWRSTRAPERSSAGTSAAALIDNGAGGAAPASDTRCAIPPQPASTLRTKWLSEAINEWRDEQFASGIWKAQSTFANSHGPSVRVFRELIAKVQRVPARSATAIWDIPMSSLAMEDIESYIKAMWKYPNRQGKKTTLSGDAKEVLAKGGPPQTRANAKKHMGHVAGLLEWAISKKYVALETLTVLRLAMKGPAEEGDGGYRAFSATELRVLAVADDCHNESFRHAWQYWAWKIALYTGARVREVAELTPDDFVIMDGLPCIWFRAGEVVEKPHGVEQLVVKRVKTVESERVVPIARVLLDLGLLEYVAMRRQQTQPWLWDHLLREDKNGRARYITAWFATHLAELGIKKAKDRGKTFHSFRSTLQQALERVELDGKVIDRILGHTDKSTRAKHYARDPEGRPFMPVVAVREKLDAIDWGVTFKPSRKWGGIPPTAQCRPPVNDQLGASPAARSP